MDTPQIPTVSFDNKQQCTQTESTRVRKLKTNLLVVYYSLLVVVVVVCCVLLLLQHAAPSLKSCDQSQKTVMEADRSFFTRSLDGRKDAPL
jgi:hypothetical protein